MELQEQLQVRVSECMSVRGSKRKEEGGTRCAWQWRVRIGLRVEVGL